MSAAAVVPYIGTWIETGTSAKLRYMIKVVPYIGTWIETGYRRVVRVTQFESYLI